MANASGSAAAHQAQDDEVLQLDDRQCELLQLVGLGCSAREIADRLMMTLAEVDRERERLLRLMNVDNVELLRAHAPVVMPVACPATHARRPRQSLLNRRLAFIPNVSLSHTGPLGSCLRAAPTSLNSLRAVAEHLLELELGAGPQADDHRQLLPSGIGTLGARQALIAALAAESGRGDVELVVGCAELKLADFREYDALTDAEPGLTLPLAVCYLRVGQRRVQVSESATGSRLDQLPASETTVAPDDLPVRRRSLYRAYAADWCRALERAPGDFARVRAACLAAARHPAHVEDLLGYGLPADFKPA